VINGPAKQSDKQFACPKTLYAFTPVICLKVLSEQKRTSCDQELFRNEHFYSCDGSKVGRSKATVLQA
jgi:hypothetical protein